MSIALHSRQLNRISARKRFARARSNGGMVPCRVVGSISREATALIGIIPGEAMRLINLGCTLTDQAALADARAERTRCLVEWRSARLRLLASAGVLNTAELDQ